MKEIVSLICPSCGGNLEQLSITRFKCAYCGNDHFISLEDKPAVEPKADQPTWEDKAIADEVRYQRFLTTRFLPLEKKAKEVWQLTMIGFAVLFFFFPAAIVIWGISAFKSLSYLRYNRFDGDTEPRSAIERSFWLSLIMVLGVIGLIVFMVFLNLASTLAGILT